MKSKTLICGCIRKCLGHPLNGPGSIAPTPRKLLLPLKTDGNWIRDNTGQVIGDFISDIEPAFIVKAVNSHEELLDGIQKLQDWLQDKYVIERDGNARAGFAHYVEFCDDLIAKAEDK